MLVETIGCGAASEYRCQPGSMRAVSRPGCALRGRTVRLRVRLHSTGLSFWAAAGTRARPPPESPGQDRSAPVHVSGCFDGLSKCRRPRRNSVSMRSLIRWSANSAPPDRVLDRVGVRAAVADDAHAAHAQQQRPAVFRVITRFFEILERVPRQHVASCACCGLKTPEHLLTNFHQALAHLQRHVPISRRKTMTSTFPLYRSRPPRADEVDGQRLTSGWPCASVRCPCVLFAIDSSPTRVHHGRITRA